MNAIYLNPACPRFDLSLQVGDGHYGKVLTAGIEAEDILTTLYTIKRFLGRTARPYSVLEHSVLVCELCDTRRITTPDVLRRALWHDAAEAYTGDIPSPVKKFCGDEFRKLEEMLDYRVMQAFDLQTLTADGVQRIKEADRLACVIEQLTLLPGVQFSTAEQELLPAAHIAIDRGLCPKHGREPSYEILRDAFLRLDADLKTKE